MKNFIARPAGLRGFAFVFFLASLVATSAQAWTPASLSDLERTAAAAPAEGLPERTDLLAGLAYAQREGDPAQTTKAADQLFDVLARDFSSGAASPALTDPGWSLPPPPLADLVALHNELHAGAPPSALLYPLLPQTPDYLALRRALADARAAPAAKTDAERLKRQTRITRLRASMERWRWLPREWPERRLEVWIPQFTTTFFNGSTAPLKAAAIVGRPQTPTLRFAATVSSITLNPVWIPPASIVRELLPGFQRDPQRASRDGFEAVDASGTLVPLANIDWAARPFPYRLRQLPGPSNPLGQIRFNLPNAHAIYLHDTSNPNLFAKQYRAFSHGCVRVGNPLKLGASLLGAPWSEAALKGEANSGQTMTIAMAQPTPIYFLYFTAAPDAAGQTVYAEDIYGLDQPLVAALDGIGAQRIATAAPVTCGAEAG